MPIPFPPLVTQRPNPLNWFTWMFMVLFLFSHTQALNTGSYSLMIIPNSRWPSPWKRRVMLLLPSFASRLMLRTCGSGPLRGMAGYSSSVASSSISLITFQTSWQLKKLQLKQWKAANSKYNKGDHNYRFQCLSMISTTDVIMMFQHLASPVTQLSHSVSFRMSHLTR